MTEATTPTAIAGDRLSSRTRVFTWITLALGIAGLVRLVPEMIQVLAPVPQVEHRYYVLVSADAIIAVLGVISGMGLLREKTWIWPICAAFWGASGAVSGFIAWVAARELIKAFERGVFIQRDWVMLPRCLYYAVMLATAPFALRVLLRPAAKGPASVLPMVICLLVSAVSGAWFYHMLIFRM